MYRKKKPHNQGSTAGTASAQLPLLRATSCKVSRSAPSQVKAPTDPRMPSPSPQLPVRQRGQILAQWDQGLDRIRVCLSVFLADGLSAMSCIAHLSKDATVSLRKIKLN